MIKWLKANTDKETVTKVETTLSSLPTGTGWMCSGEARIFEQIKFPKFKTYDNTATPTGDSEEQTVKTATVDQENLRSIIGDAVKEAEANDPKLLRKKIADLEKAARGRTALAEHRAPGKSSLVAEGGKDGRSEGFADGARALGSKLEAELPKLVQAIAGSAPKARQARPTPQAPARPNPTSEGLQPDHARRWRSYRPAPLSGPQQKILNALAWMESVDLPAAIRTQLALLADQSPTSSGYVNNLSALRSRGLIDYPGTSKVALTDSGRAIAQPGESPTTSEELQEQVFQKLSGPQCAILRKLIDIHPAYISRPELAEAAIQSPTSSGYVNNLSRLHALGLISYPSKGVVSATDLLF